MFAIATSLLLLSLAVPSVDAVVQQQHSFVTKAAVGIGALSSSSTSTAASTSTTTTDNNEPSAVIEQYYQELSCPAPKSCSVQPSSSSNNNDNRHHAECSYSTLRGLAQTRQQMEAKSANSLMDDNDNVNNKDSYKAAATTGLKLQLAHVRLEEAAVGCALLKNHINTNQEADTSGSSGSKEQQRPEIKYTTNFIQDKLQQFAHGTKVELEDEEGEDIICPKPKSCNFILKPNISSSSSAKKKKKSQQKRGSSSRSGNGVCDMKHLHQLHNTGIAIDTSLDDISSSRDGNDGDNGKQLEMLAKRLELADVDAEAATVGCVLLLQRHVELLRSSNHLHHHPQHLNNGEASSKKPDHQKQHQLEENNPSSPLSKLASHFERLKEEDEQFTYFLHQNHHHITTFTTPTSTTTATTTDANNNEENELKTLINGYQTIQQKRYKIEAVLNFAGKGEVPDIIWQERVSREKAVERLLGDELRVRSRLLELILERVHNGDLLITQLDLRDKPKEEVEDTRNYWDWMADKLEAEQEEERLGRERGEEKERVRRVNEEEEGRRRRVKEIGKYSPQPSPSQEECRDGNGNGEGGEQSCTATNTNANDKQQTPSPTSNSDDNETATIMIDRMKRDIELLRSKAQDATSKEERDARLGLVKELEKQSKLMMG